MSAQILLDMTRAAGRRWNGTAPTGIDRVCDAYAAHFSQRAIAVIQIRGRAVLLNRAASDNLMQSLDGTRGEFRRSLVASLTMSAAAPLQKSETANAFYLNVGHSDFDLEAHWKWVRRRALHPIYLLHDLIPITNPSVTTAHKSARHRGRVESAIRRATGIVANSHTTATAIKDFAREQKMKLPPLLVSLIAGGSLPDVRSAVAPGDDYFLCLGTVERRKNPLLLLRVWERLITEMGDDTPRLVLAGTLGSGSEDVIEVLVNNPALARHVEFKRTPDDRELSQLLSHARAVLLPSLAEGYGIPLVEALERQVPVIGSDLDSFRELGQGIPTLLSPHDVEAWLNAVRDFCKEGQNYQEQLRKISQFSPPRWNSHFAKVDEWLEQVKSEIARVPTVSGASAAVA